MLHAWVRSLTPDFKCNLGPAPHHLIILGYETLDTHTYTTYVSLNCNKLRDTPLDQQLAHDTSGLPT